jgi:TRAP-type uncharacterized transport system substrate-binding protein
VKFIDVTPQLSKLQELSPVYEEATIAADTYDTGEDVPTFLTPNHLMVRNDMPENLACALTTLLVEEKAQLVKVHPSAEEINPEMMTKTGPVPLHPGSERALTSLQK